MIVLGLETSSRVCSAGLADDHDLRCSKTLVEGTIHSEKLLPLVHSLLGEQHISLSQLDAIAVSSGPGSFTGLRIGFSAAKGLCFSSAKPLVVVSTFGALAHSAFQAAPNAENIVVALDAKKGDFYVGLFRPGPDGILPVGETILLAAQALPTRIPTTPGTVILTDSIEMVSPLVSSRTRFLNVADHYRGEIIASLGVQMALRGVAFDNAEAEPLYLKDFVVKGRAVAT
ncbi:MAG: tRNA (adenosine(37)-N6)-threonylcarbamoyltransferase complex dimerization subunit type 1 TsaB [Bacteroidota bacterium]